MPNRIIKESIWSSPNMNNCSRLAEWHFFRILPLTDDHGCFESTPRYVKGRCYPLREDVTLEEIMTWQDELETCDLIIRWQDHGREYAVMPKFFLHQRIRSLHKRKSPSPPDDIVSRCQALSGIDRLYPIPNPILIPIPNPNYIVIFDDWNKQKIQVHQRLTDEMKSAIKRALKNHTEEEICKAIVNYNTIIKGDEYYFNHYWTLADFLNRGLEKFLDWEVAKLNYMRKDDIGTHKGRARQLPTEYKTPEEHREEYKREHSG